MTVRILHGDCRSVLKTLPDASVQCCVTSPPYWGLRRYLPEGHPDQALELGSEETPDAYVAGMVEVFREVKRVLRDDGTLWLNIGDAYANDGKWGGATGGKHANYLHGGESRIGREKRLTGLKPKDLIGLPWMLAFALRADGWWLRSDVIWAKPNPMPESCTDRPTSAHEHIFLLTKRERYFYDAEAVREPTIGLEPGDLDGGPQRARDGSNANGGRNFRKVKITGGWDRGDGAHGTIHREGRTSAEYQETEVKSCRNLRNVWTIATAPFPQSHFATFPPELAERCIKAGTSERGACSTCGAPWARIVTKGAPDEAHRAACGADASGGYAGQSTKGHAAAGVQDASAVKARILAGLRERASEWRPSCGCNAAARRCVVLDPFAGAGTSLMAADRLGRDAVGIELSEEYCEMARRRLVKDAGLFMEIAE